MPIDPVNPLGWGPKDPITSPQMNGIDQRLVRAVDGVQGGTYSGPLILSNAKLTGASSIDTTGSITTKGTVQATAVLLGATTVGGLADGANVDCVGLQGSAFHLSTAAAVAGTIHITLTWSWVIPEATYVVTLDHSNMFLAHVDLAWSGAGVNHRFAGGPEVDGQATPYACRDVWLGFALSSSEILWSITRGLI